MSRYRLAFDIGGTFTDVVLADLETDGCVLVHKTLTTPADPSVGVLRGVVELLEAHQVDATETASAVVGATTLVTNTLLEHKGVRTALVVTRGFRDVLEIGREWRYDIFDLQIALPEPLAPQALRFEVDERVGARGEIVRPLDDASLHEVIARLAAERVESVAICFMHSYADDTHERIAAAAIAAALPGVHVSTSADVLPEIREFERMSATVANAYVQPAVARHIADLGVRVREALPHGDLFLMHSNGGLVSTASAAAAPIRLLESGPAAGALAAAHYARRLGIDRLVAFDMGGTTAKACVIRDGRPKSTLEFEAGRARRFARGSGYPIHLPSLDLIEIGAGGGSIARVDRLGLLKVGPDSQGADPGPACYGLGGLLPTVTDADVVLGYIDPDTFLGGAMRLDRDAAEHAIRTHVADPLGLDIVEAASGIHRVATSAMATAVRVHLAEHGQDPERYALFAFGGAGPVHAREVARVLRLQAYLVPPDAGVGSAFGLLVAPPKIDRGRSFPAQLDDLDWRALEALDGQLADAVVAELALLGVRREEVELERSADMRFVGQGYEIEVPLGLGAVDSDIAERLHEAFAVAYADAYGRVPSTGAVELISWRVSGSRPPSPIAGAPRLGAASSSALPSSRRVYFVELEAWVETPVVPHGSLEPGATFTGPVVVEQGASTAVVGPGDRVAVAPDLALLVEGEWIGARDGVTAAAGATGGA